MKRAYYYISIFAVLLCLASAGSVFAAAPVAKNVPTSIKAANMTYNADGQTVVFSGDVHVSRPDFELWTKKLTVFLKKTKNGNSDAGGLSSMQGGELDRIVADGDVRIKTKDGKTGNSGKLTYNAASGTLVMEGSPILRDKATYIKGDRITHYIQTGRSDVEGNVTGEFQSTDATPLPEEGQTDQ